MISLVLKISACIQTTYGNCRRIHIFLCLGKNEVDLDKSNMNDKPKFSYMWIMIYICLIIHNK